MCQSEHLVVCHNINFLIFIVGQTFTKTLILYITRISGLGIKKYCDFQFLEVNYSVTQVVILLTWLHQYRNTYR